MHMGRGKKKKKKEHFRRFQKIKDQKNKEKKVGWIHSFSSCNNYFIIYLCILSFWRTRYNKNNINNNNNMKSPLFFKPQGKTYTRSP